LWRHFEREHWKLATAIKQDFLLKLIALLKGKEPKHGPVLDVIEEIGGKRECCTPASETGSSV
jgi:hypothetical protein